MLAQALANKPIKIWGYTRVTGMWEIIREADPEEVTAWLHYITPNDRYSVIKASMKRPDMPQSPLCHREHKTTRGCSLCDPKNQGGR